MKGKYLGLTVVVAVAIAAGAAFAEGFYLARTGTDIPIVGDVNVASGQNITFDCYLDTAAAGNTFEVMVGYDKSSRATYGAGIESDHVYGRLALLGSVADIAPAYNVIRTAEGGIYAAKALVINASAREDNNDKVGAHVPENTRPFGFTVREAKASNTAPGKVKLFSFTLRNQMLAAGDYQYVVLSNKAGGNSYSDAWKNGVALTESAFFVKVVNSSSLPAIGANNKAVLDSTIMNSAASKYIWVLWGKVSNLDAGSGTFNIDDGSGVIIHVAASAGEISSKGIVNGSYVAAKGTLDVGAKTLTSQSLTKYN